MQETHVSNAVDNSTLMEVINHFDKKEINSIKNFEALVEELLVKPVKENKQLVNIEVIGKLKALNPDVGKGGVLQSPNYRGDLFPLQLELKLTPSKEYLSAFKRVLEEAKTSKGNRAVRVYERNLGDSKTIYLTSGYGEKKVYYISEDKANVIRDKLSNLFNDYRFLKIELLDSEKEDFKEITFCTYDYDCNNHIPKYIDSNDFLFLGVQGFSGALLPSLTSDVFFPKEQRKLN